MTRRCSGCKESVSILLSSIAARLNYAKLKLATCFLMSENVAHFTMTHFPLAPMVAHRTTGVCSVFCIGIGIK